MMSQSDLPLLFWGYALETAAFTLNRVPSKSVVKTPYEMWTGKSPSLSFLKIWGCEVYVKRLMTDKLTPKSDMLFHGISEGNFRVLLLQPIRGQSVCCSEWCFLRERVSQKRQKWIEGVS